MDGYPAESVARVSEQTATRLQRHKLKPRSIVLPRRGEITKRAYIREDQEGWLCGTGCLKIEIYGRHLVPEYLYYFLEQEHVTKWLLQHAVGTTMLNLSAAIVSGVPIRYPSTNAQQGNRRDSCNVRQPDRKQLPPHGSARRVRPAALPRMVRPPSLPRTMNTPPSSMAFRRDGSGFRCLLPSKSTQK
jgi:hypothetical protein